MSSFQLRNIRSCDRENQGTHPATDDICALPYCGAAIKESYELNTGAPRSESRTGFAGLLAINPDITHPPDFLAQTFPGLMALCPELKPVYHGVLLRQYGEGLWEITP